MIVTVWRGWGALILGACLLMGQESGPAVKPPRRALLIINSAYRHLTPLDAPKLDQKFLEDGLKAAGFQTTTFSDVPSPELLPRLDKEFLAKLNAGDHVLVYFAGYTLQVPLNVLLAVDYDPATPRGAVLSVGRILDELDDRKAGLKIVALDGARREDRLIPRDATTKLGLSFQDLSLTSETLVIYPAPPDELAPDPPAGGADALGGALGKLIRQPGMSLSDLCPALGREAPAAYCQPRFSQTFVFVEPPPPPKVAPPPPTIVEVPADTFRQAPQQNLKDRQDYKYIPPGKFLMGCVPSTRKEDACQEEEKPRHPVTITKGFWIGLTEVTIGRFERYFEMNRDLPKRVKIPKHSSKDLPMVSLSQEDALAFCRWAGGRLPTEAEWEYVARGGRENEVLPLNSENAREKANFFEKQGNDRWQDEAAPAKSFDKGPFDLYDIFGNVWEWTADWFSPTYYGESPAVDPPGPATGKFHVIRGGSFYSDWREHLRISFRRPGKKEGGDIVGFRCVLDDTPETHKRLGR